MTADISAAPEPKPRKLFWLLIGLGILVGGFLLMNLLRALAPKPQQVETLVNIPTVTTRALGHREGPLLVSGNGLVVPRAEITLSAQVSGEVVAMHPDLRTGGQFRDGDLLLQIDPRLFEANLQEARASRQALQSNLDLLERQLTRAQSLQKGGFVDENSVDDLTSRRDQARANLSRQDAIILSRQLDLEHTRLTAPFDGYVLSENVDVGDIVAPGRELARFYASANAEIVVSLNVDDTGFIPDLWTDRSIRNATVQAEFGGQLFTWPAQVDRVEAGLDRTTRTVDVVVTVADPSQPGTPVNPAASGMTLAPPPLLVGMYTRVTIEGMTLPGHFLLPVSAVHDGSIRILEGESRLRLAPVQVLRQEGNDLVLLAPELPEGTRIITSDIALVTDGMQVRVAESAR